MDRESEVALVLEQARAFRRLGMNPLASCGLRGHPPYNWRRVRDRHQADRELEARFSQTWPDGPDAGRLRIESPALQVPAGAAHQLCVADVEAGVAREVWSDLVRFRPVGPTWMARSGGGGLHVYFRLPAGLAAFPWRIVWWLEDGGVDALGRPTHVKHELIELLGDGRLAMTPPSRKPSGRYAWLPGCSPAEVAAPCPMPAWLAAMPAVRSAPARRGKVSGGPGPLRRLPLEAAGRYSYKEVLAAIPDADKLSIAASILRFAGACDAGREWCDCHAAGRPDARPSARFSPCYGYYAEPGSGLRMSLFDLMAAFGGYPSPMAARDALGAEYIGRRANSLLVGRAS